ncbi:MAG: DUF2860 family protein [Campylobacteraceae bacterium]|nr:DUF2860 family protein [Campylobacteraceae bacterium]
MKKILLSAALIGSLFAQEENFIELGAGFVNSKDNFSTNNSENISSLSNASEENEGFALVDFYYGYELSDDTSIYASMMLGQMSLGTNFMTDIGSFDIGISSGFGDEEWENPFLTNTNRKKTDVSEIGAYIGYGFSLAKAHNAQLIYSYSVRSYDTETVQDSLKRDGNRHVIVLENSYTPEFGKGKFTYLFNTSLENYDAKGDASTYSAVMFELGITMDVTKSVNMTLIAGLGSKEYDKSNPEFGKTVDADISSLVAVVKWDKPFEYKNFYTTFKVGYEEEDANVDFYDKESTFTLLSLGYKF